MSFRRKLRATKAFACDICRQAFETKYAMVCHRQKVHDGTFYTRSPPKSPTADRAVGLPVPPSYSYGAAPRRGSRLRTKAGGSNITWENEEDGDTEIPDTASPARSKAVESYLNRTAGSSTATTGTKERLSKRATKLEMEVFAAIGARENVIVGVQKLVTRLHERAQSQAAACAGGDDVSPRDVTELLENLIGLRMATVRVAAKMRAWQRAVEDVEEFKRGKTTPGRRPWDTAVFRWRGADYAFKACYDLAAIVAALPAPLENWLKQFIPLTDNPLLLKTKLKDSHEAPKPVSKMFTFVLEGHAARAAAPSDSAEPYYAFSIATKPSAADLVGAVEWPADDDRDTAMPEKIKAVRALAALCTRTRRKGARLERKYNVETGETTLSIQQQDLSKPLSPLGAEFDAYRSMYSLAPGDVPSSAPRGLSAAASPGNPDVAPPSPARIDANLKLLVTKLVDVGEGHGRHVAGDIDRAGHFFQGELHKRWQRKEEERRTRTKAFTRTLCQRLVTFAVNGAQQKIMHRLQRNYAVLQLQRAFRRYHKRKRQGRAAAVVAGILAFRDRRRLGRGVRAFIMNNRKKESLYKRCSRTFRRMYRMHLVLQARRGDRATQIQSLVRGHFGRQRSNRRKRLVKRWSAAGAIQSKWRFFRVRRDQKALFIQAFYRAYRARLVTHARREERTSVLVMMAVRLNQGDARLCRLPDTDLSWRPPNSGIDPEALWEDGRMTSYRPRWMVRHYAVLGMQRLSRGFLVRRRALRRRRANAALVLQCAFRCFSARKRLHEALNFAFFFMSASILQVAERSRAARKNVSAMRAERLEMLQSIAQEHSVNGQGRMRVREVEAEEYDGDDTDTDEEAGEKAGEEGEAGKQATPLNEGCA